MTAQNPSPLSSIADLSKTKEYIWPCASTYYAEPIALERGEGMHVTPHHSKEIEGSIAGTQCLTQQ
jgi:hypothetical protein